MEKGTSDSKEFNIFESLIKSTQINIEEIRQLDKEFG